MRAWLAVVFLYLTTCVGSPPVPCTDCNGKCVDTTTDAKNCGGCGKKCGVGTLCSESKCVAACTPEQQLCSSGCADTMADRGNCGTCGHACAAGEVCSGGSCAVTCGAGYSTCTLASSDVVCVDLSGDVKHCGQCNMPCGAGQVCIGMQCTAQCSGGRMLCNATSNPYCTDVMSDNTNCGACGTLCQGGLACNNGSCDSQCAAPLTSCNADAGTAAHYCANLATDTKNCGGCGAVCDVGYPCVAGTCRPPIIFRSCDDVREAFGAVEGEYILHAGGNPYRPFRAYCADMDGGATDVLFDGGVVATTNPGVKTYLTLARTGAGQNFSEHDNTARFILQLPDGGCPDAAPCWPPTLTNQWSRLRLDVSSSRVFNDDYRFATTQGKAQNWGNRDLDFGTAAACSCGSTIGNANVDLRGTPFAIDPTNLWVKSGAGPLGAATPGGAASNGKLMNVTGDGCCGDNSLISNPAGARRLLVTPVGVTCNEIRSITPSAQNGVYSLLDGNGGPDAGGPLHAPLAWCDMTNGGGGWTLVMKVDGTNPASRFFYDDPLWTSEWTYNAGVPDLAKSEAKYPSFVSTPFASMRLVIGEADGGITRSLTFTTNPFESMLDAMRGPFTGTQLQLVAGWTQFLSGTAQTLQPFCGQEGINNATPCGTCRTRVRIGILGNEQMDCGSPDSYAGIGGQMPNGNCGTPATFKGYSAGAFGGAGCGGGNADGGAFVYVYVR